MATFFLDASYVIALETADDQNHAAALQHWQSLRDEPLTLVTTSYRRSALLTDEIRDLWRC
jgi:uncharacterized protein